MPTPPPVPPVADASRTQTYTVSSPTASIDLQFPLYGDSTDIEIFVNAVLLDRSLWTVVSKSGVPISLAVQPIADGQVQFSPSLTTGAVIINGNWRPRRVTQPTAPGINRREFNQAFSNIISSQREQHDFVSRALRAIPSDPPVGVLPPLSARRNGGAGSIAAYDGNGDPSIFPVSSAAFLADVAAVADDLAAANADVVLTHADVVLTHADVALTHADRVQTGNDVVAADLARDQAQAYAEIAGVYKAYATKAAANSDIGSVPANAFIEVLVDESLSGGRSVYQEVAGVYTFVRFLPSTLTDHLGRQTTDPATLDFRSGNLRGHRALADIRNGVRTSLRIGVIGDSLGTLTWQTPHDLAHSLFVSHFPGTPVYCHPITGPGSPYWPPAVPPNIADTAAHSSGPQATNSTAHVKDAGGYANYNWIGTYYNVIAGQFWISGDGANGILCDRVIVPIIREPGAGEVRIRIVEATLTPAFNDPSWRDPLVGEITSGGALNGSSQLVIDANGALGLIWVVLDFATLAQRSVQINNTSGSVNLWPEIMHEVRNNYGINVWRLSIASNSFRDLTAGARQCMTDWIQNADFDFIFAESDDDLIDYQTLLPELKTVIDATSIVDKPTVIFDGNPYMHGSSTTEAGLIARNEYVKRTIAGWQGYDYLPGLEFAGGYNEVLAAGWETSPPHFAGDLPRLYFFNWAISRGYANIQFRDPGGRATTYDILSSSGLRAIQAQDAVALKLAPDYQTELAAWSFKDSSNGAAGTGLGSATPTWLAFDSGATANSTIVAYINEPTPSFFYGTGASELFPGGFCCAIRLIGLAVATGIFRIFFAADRAYNAAYTGALASAGGYGFEIANRTLRGFAWDGAALNYTAGITLDDYPNAIHQHLEVRITPQTNSASVGTAGFAVNGKKLGELAINDFANPGAFRAEHTNGATASSSKINMTPPRVVVLVQ